MTLSRILTLGMIFVAVGCGSAPHDAGSMVPLGSPLSDLDRHMQRGAGSTGKVVEWLPSTSLEKGRRIKNELGEFVAVDRGDYDQWKASAPFSSFSGEITFIHDGSTSADVNEFTYVKGVLKKRDWGFLPG